MIKIYSQEGCPQCKVLKMQLGNKNIEYINQYVTEEDVQTLIDKGFKGLPVMELEDGSLLKLKDAMAWVKEH